MGSLCVVVDEMFNEVPLFQETFTPCPEKFLVVPLRRMVIWKNLILVFWECFFITLGYQQVNSILNISSNIYRLIYKIYNQKYFFLSKINKSPHFRLDINQTFQLLIIFQGMLSYYITLMVLLLYVMFDVINSELNKIRKLSQSNQTFPG